MRSANLSSLPASASAITTATSFADCVASARMASRTMIVRPGSSPSLVGGCAAAHLETRMRLLGLSLPRSIASNSRYSVIILVSEAG